MDVDYGVIAGAQPSVRVEATHNWQKVGREPVGFSSPESGFWVFVVGLGLGMFLGPELISLTKTGKVRLRELAERKIRG